MNGDQIGGIIRAIMAAFGGYALEHGITQDQWLALTGGAVAIVAVLWSLYSNSTEKMIATVADRPEVKHVVVKSPTLAISIPSNKVVKG